MAISGIVTTMLSVNSSIFADDMIEFSHSQTTTDDERLGSVPGGLPDGPIHDDRVKISVVNFSAYTWDDYHITITNSIGPARVIGLSDVFLGTHPFEHTSGGFYSSAGNGSVTLNLDGGTIANLDVFDIEFSVAHNASVDIVGHPSFHINSVPTPEPSTFALAGLGSLSLAIGAYRGRRRVV